MILAPLLQQHTGSTSMELTYFWSGVFIALVPVGIFGTIGFFVVRAIRRENRRKKEKESESVPGIPG